MRKIITFSTLIDRQQKLTIKSKSYFDKIITSPTKMSNLIKDVLNYSRLDKADKELDTIDFNIVLATVKNDLDLLINEHKATIICDTLPVISSTG